MHRCMNNAAIVAQAVYHWTQMLVSTTDAGPGSSRLSFTDTISELLSANAQLLSLHNYIMANYLPFTAEMVRVFFRVWSRRDIHSAIQHRRNTFCTKPRRI